MAANKSGGKSHPLFAFSSDLSLLATCSSDNRVKVWETSSSALLVDCSALPPPQGSSNEALLGPFTCLAWGLVTTSLPKTPGGKKKKTPAPGEPRHLLFAGTVAGEVVAWEPASSRVLWKSSRGRPEDDVTALVAADVTSTAAPAVVWAGTRDGTLLEMSAQSGEILSSFSAVKSAVTCLALSADNSKVLVGGVSLKVVDLSNRKKVWKVTGHTSPATCCTLSQDGKFALSAARNERHVAIWDCSTAKSQSTLGTLSTVDDVVSFSCLSGDSATGQKSNSTVKVLLVTSAGDAYFWSAKTPAELPAVKPTVIKPALAAQKADKGSKTPKGRVLFGAAGSESGSGGAVMLVRGSVAKPRVEIVSVQDKEGETVTLPALLQGDLLQHKGVSGSAAKGPKKGKSAQALAQQNGPEAASAFPGAWANGDVDMEDLGIESGAAQGNGPSNEEEGKKKKKKRKAGEGGGEGSKEGEEQEGDGETLEMKLRSLGITTMDAGGQEASTKVLGRKAGATEGEAPPRADSLLVLLQQAVAAEDDRLLEHCLGVKDEGIIANTVRHLPPRTAVKFLSLAVSRMRTKPSRARALAPWLRALCVSHTALLMSTPGAQPLLTALFQEVDSRVALFQPMLSLSGRLDLVVSSIRQIQHSKKSERSSAGGTDELDGVAVLDEANEASDIEVEDVTGERGEGEEGWESGTDEEGQGEEGESGGEEMGEEGELESEEGEEEDEEEEEEGESEAESEDEGSED